jgi:hypothetical protein
MSSYIEQPDKRQFPSSYAKLQLLVSIGGRAYALVQPMEFTDKEFEPLVGCPSLKFTSEWRLIEAEHIRCKVHLVADYSNTDERFDSWFFVNIWVNFGKCKFPESERQKILEDLKIDGKQWNSNWKASRSSSTRKVTTPTSSAYEKL